MPRDTLASFPFVQVRIACKRCGRTGSYRLARLAAKYGADIRLPDLLAHLAGDCQLWERRHPWQERCGAYFVDLEPPRPPPDLPPATMQRLRVVAGGRG